MDPRTHDALAACAQALGGEPTLCQGAPASAPPRLVFGDPESIALRDRGRTLALEAQARCPHCNRRRPVQVVQFLSDAALWGCNFCWASWQTDLEGRMADPDDYEVER